MQIKLDENRPATLLELLSGVGHDVESTLQEGLRGADDHTIWRAAQHESRFLVTQDLDFSDTRRFRPGTHSGVLLVRLRDGNRKAVIERVRALFMNEPVESWSGCMVVVTERKLRIRRPS